MSYGMPLEILKLIFFNSISALTISSNKYMFRVMHVEVSKHPAPVQVDALKQLHFLMNGVFIFI